MDISNNDKKETKKPCNYARRGSRAGAHPRVARLESEKNIEAALVREVSKMGGLCLKYASSTTTGYPDRLVLLPEGKVFWVELKSTGKKPGKKQELRHQELRALGQTVFVVDSMHKMENTVALMLRAVIAARIRREEGGDLL